MGLTRCGNCASMMKAEGHSRARVAAILGAALAGVLAVGSATFADKTKADNTTALNVGASWVGSVVPGAGDMAIFDKTLNSNFTFSLGDNLQSWFGIRVLDPASPLTINAGNTLTLGAGGIDLSAAIQALTLNNNLALAGSGTWSNNTNSTLQVSGVISGSSGFIKAGAGSLILTAANTNTGLVNVSGGALILGFGMPGAPTANILNPASVLALGGQLAAPVGSTPIQTVSTLSLITGAAKISFPFGTLTLNSISANGQPLSGVRANTLMMDTVNGGGTILWGGSGNDFSARPLITDSNGNAFATFGLNDWAATDSSGKVIAATYTQPATGSTITSAGNIEFPNGVSGQVNVNSGTITSVRFGTNTGFATLNINGGQTVTIGGFLMGNDSLVSTFVGGSTGVIRPLMTSGSGGAYLHFINNNGNLSNLDVFPIIADNGTNSTFIVKSGLGRVRLFGTQNSFTGSVTINEGVLTINDNRVLGPVALGNPVFLNGGVLQVSANVTLANGTANARGIILTANGGGLDPSDGFGANSTLTVPGVISGEGVLTKLLGGTLSLTNSTGNTYAGGTTITAGTVVTSNASGSALGSGPVLMTGGVLRGTGIVTGAVTLSGGSLSGTGTYAGAIDVQASGHVAPGNPGAPTFGVGTVNTNAIKFESTSTLDLDFALTGGNDAINVLNNGAVSIGSPTSVNLFIAGGTTSFAANGTYAIATNVTNLTGGAGSLANLQVLNGAAGATYGFSLSGSNLVLTISGGVTLSNWKTNGGGSWGTAANWTAAIPGAAGDIALFGSAFSGPGSATVTLDGARTLGILIINNTGGSYVFSAGSGGALTLDNAGTDVPVTVTGSHTINVPVHLNANNVNFSTSGTADALIFTNVIDGPANINISGPGTFVVAGTAGNNQFTILAGGTLQIGNGGTTGSLNGPLVASSGTLKFNRSDVVTYSDFLSGTGGITQAGSGTLIITNTNSNTGTNSVTNGVLQLGPGAALGTGPFAAVGGKLDLNANNATLGTLSGAAGIIDNSGGGTVTLGINETGNSTFSGAIRNTTGVLNLVKGGNSVLTLSGTGSFTGSVTILAGAIVANSSSALLGASEIDVNAATGIRLGGGVTLSAPVKVGVGAAEFMDVPGAVNATLASNVTIADPPINPAIQYRLGIAGTGTLTLTGTHTVPAALSGPVPMTTFLTRGNLSFQHIGILSLEFHVDKLSRPLL